MASPSQVLAWITATGVGDLADFNPEGYILEASGDFAVELQEAGAMLDEHGFAGIPTPPHLGLLVFEGWVESRGAAEHEGEEVDWEGWWRELTSWELLQLRFGKRLFQRDTAQEEDHGEPEPDPPEA